MPEPRYALHTDRCTYVLDDEGVCLRVLSRTGASPRAAGACVGAQFVACLDLAIEGGLVGELRVGAYALFVRPDDDGKQILLRTTPLLSIENVVPSSERRTAPSAVRPSRDRPPLPRFQDESEVTFVKTDMSNRAPAPASLGSTAQLPASGARGRRAGERLAVPVPHAEPSSASDISTRVRFEFPPQVGRSAARSVLAPSASPASAPRSSSPSKPYLPAAPAASPAPAARPLAPPSRPPQSPVVPNARPASAPPPAPRAAGGQPRAATGVRPPPPIHPGLLPVVTASVAGPSRAGVGDRPGSAPARGARAVMPPNRATPAGDSVADDEVTGRHVARPTPPRSSPSRKTPPNRRTSEDDETTHEGAFRRR